MLLAEVIERKDIFTAKQLGAHVTKRNLSRAYLNPPGVKKSHCNVWSPESLVIGDFSLI